MVASCSHLRRSDCARRSQRRSKAKTRCCSIFPARCPPESAFASSRKRLEEASYPKDYTQPRMQLLLTPAGRGSETRARSSGRRVALTTSRASPIWAGPVFSIPAPSRPRERVIAR